MFCNSKTETFVELLWFETFFNRYTICTVLAFLRASSSNQADSPVTLSCDTS